ncbi:glucose-6-phosphate isomerase [Piscirickettsia salmonis]|uniref:Glucose-6-phosphate isomerase n=1 Tax=Piscirickettsia salmonis TaxID=1238 RepID=A0A9Q6PUG9_PISSA|nr:glucose-6-phosphate isomerase [Piscirickettsia salmonis]ALA25900.1 phosphoglucose isomerase family protein [Piscirickettsia salmonis]APS43371.1 glucose-6-phosphate isomerase [Piscirickettsia salmonis]APS46722.1 glucose-6-phosphate isomerase [Piscirickettsia salmonis]APS50695.1 glucose-6-phosphate isomerase [Piscirickettsia salmonis]APS53899.1 glucose-6-phosphate isomerase [Piscirickettsia salmonis]
MNTAAWTKLTAHQQEIKHTHLRDLFINDSQRFNHYFKQGPHLSIDFSKNHLTNHTLKLLIALAQEHSLGDKIHALMQGATLNITEKRAAFHSALRVPASKHHQLPKAVAKQITTVHAQMRTLCAKIHGQTPLYSQGQIITDIVNLGIGGSDLGPAMVTTALTPYHKKHLRCHFVSNVDGNQLHNTLKNLKPETTLFIIASKSFTTQETFANAQSARHWLETAQLSTAQINHHFICCTSKPEKAREFGILAEHILPMWDWVGGRYSLWSSIGLPIALATGFDHFEALLAGAHAMDNHFQTASFEDNLPVMLGLIGLWYINFWHTRSHALLPYEQMLTLFPSHFQQVDMESNGKHVQINGEPVNGQTAPVIWGQPGTNGQHAYHQMLFQGTEMIPMDFIVGLKTHSPYQQQHNMLVANCFAQTRGLMWGCDEKEVYQQMINQGVNQTEAQRLAPHKAIIGNQPSTTILYDKLTPESLGALIALYEHKVFVQGVIWNINSFDQYGVELGKVIGQNILAQLQGGSNIKNNNIDDYDASTQGLIHYFRNNQ